VSAHTIGQAMMDRADVQIDSLDRTEGALHVAQIFVATHNVGGSECILSKIGADDMEAIELAFGVDRIDLAGEGEMVVGDGQSEMLAIL